MAWPIPSNTCEPPSCQGTTLKDARWRELGVSTCAPIQGEYGSGIVQRVAGLVGTAFQGRKNCVQETSKSACPVLFLLPCLLGAVFPPLKWKWRGRTEIWSCNALYFCARMQIKEGHARASLMCWKIIRKHCYQLL